MISSRCFPSPQQGIGRSRIVTMRWAFAAIALLSRPVQADDSIMPGPIQRENLVRLVQSDHDAGKLFHKLEKQANEALHSDPHPIEHIATAGVLQANEAKIESRAALEDMTKLHALGYVYLVTSNADYAAAAQRFIRAWAARYQPSGSPVDETKLEPLFFAYGFTRHDFGSTERGTVDDWLRLIARREREDVKPGAMTSYNNWNSHRLKIVGLIGFALGDQELQGYAIDGFRTQIDKNLLPDGSSFDFHERDALHYHCYDLEPLLTLAIVAHQHGIELYNYEAPNGASLRKSVGFLVPYCEGTKTHAEWVHSKVEFDRKRAEAGEAKFKIGADFNPRDGLPTLALAAFFEPSLIPLVGKLADARPDDRFPTWQTVLNEALRP